MTQQEDQGLNIMGMDDIEIQNTSVDEIDSEVVNLIMVGIDGSGSMLLYTQTMMTALNDFKGALINSKEVDELLLARADFFNTTVTIGGYKKVDQFDTSYNTQGMTPLYDVVVEGADKLLTYMEFLKNQGMRVKAVFSIFSDGADTSSKATAADARRKIQELNNKEIVTAFISFGSEAEKEASQLDFKNVLRVGSSETELRNAFNCLSKSIIESSKSVVPDAAGFFTM